MIEADGSIVVYLDLQQVTIFPFMDIEIITHDYTFIKHSVIVASCFYSPVKSSHVVSQCDGVNSGRLVANLFFDVCNRVLKNPKCSGIIFMKRRE